MRRGVGLLLAALLACAIVGASGCVRPSSASSAVSDVSSAWRDFPHLDLPRSIVHAIIPSWPATTPPTSHTAWAGATAAHQLVSIVTTLPTVSTPPSWAGKFGGVIDGVQTNSKVVALTFDDGPTAHTRAIVDTLRRYGDHATFFWVGSRITTSAAEYSLAHREELANHTWNHPNMWKLTSAEASAEIGLTNARIAQFTGKPPVWFRSPFNRLYSRELAQIKAHRLLYANYNVTSIDWIAGASTADILGKLSDNLRPGGVILMHDSPNHDPATFLPQALQLLKSRGYTVVTMSQLAQMGPPVNEPLVLGIKGLGY